jgi:hypothetical protein
MSGPGGSRKTDKQAVVQAGYRLNAKHLQARVRVFRQGTKADGSAAPEYGFKPTLLSRGLQTQGTSAALQFLYLIPAQQITRHTVRRPLVTAARQSGCTWWF